VQAGEVTFALKIEHSTLKHRSLLTPFSVLQSQDHSPSGLDSRRRLQHRTVDDRKLMDAGFFQ
jgi:hypothetical protein